VRHQIAQRRITNELLVENFLLFIIQAHLRFPNAHPCIGAAWTLPTVSSVHLVSPQPR
jgi:hypothetical protein